MNKLSELIKILIKRWTSESPEKYKKITDIAAITGMVSSALLGLPEILSWLSIPLIIPTWPIPILSFLFALSAKLTTK